MNATILRPWHILGPGQRWLYALLPMYWLMELLPPTRAGGRRLVLVTLKQMMCALVNAVENPSRGVRIVEVPEIPIPATRTPTWAIRSPVLANRALLIPK
jgi:hypothetical protein